MFEQALLAAEELLKTWKVLENDRLEKIKKENEKLEDKKNKMHAALSVSKHVPIKDDFRKIPIVPSP